MDSSGFPDLWAWLMFRKLSNLHEPWASANLKTLETSLVPINHEKHEQVDTMFYLSYTQQLIHHTSLHSLRLCSQVLFKAIKNVMLPHVKSSVKFLKVSQKNICLHSWTEKRNFRVWSSRKDVQKMFWPSRLQSIAFWSTYFGRLCIALESY